MSTSMKGILVSIVHWLSLITLYSASFYFIYWKLPSTIALLSFTSPNLTKQAWTVAPAEFGHQSERVKAEGFVILPANETYHTECASEPVGINPYIQHIKQQMSLYPNKWILIIDEMNCSFVNKVSTAEQINASAAVICASTYETLFTMASPPNWVDNITIPSVLLSRSDCEILMNVIGVQNWIASNQDMLLYPNANNMNYAFAQVEWYPNDLQLFLSSLLAQIFVWYFLTVLLNFYFERREFNKRAKECTAIIHEYRYRRNEPHHHIAIKFITNKTGETSRFRVLKEIVVDEVREKGQIINIKYDPKHPLNISLHPLNIKDSARIYYILCFLVAIIVLLYHILGADIYKRNILYLFIELFSFILIWLIVRFVFKFIPSCIYITYAGEIEEATDEEILAFEQNKNNNTIETNGETDV